MPASLLSEYKLARNGYAGRLVVNGIHWVCRNPGVLAVMALAGPAIDGKPASSPAGNESR
jgi:hypothetical protein